MKLEAVRIQFPEDCNVIVGHAHFIKTVEDLHEIMVSTSPHVKFGLAFCEASQDRLIRKSGNDAELTDAAVSNARAIGAGHLFVIVLKNGFPINFLNAIKQCPEVARVFCATANPLEVIVAETAQGRGVLGVVDGESPVGVEDAEHTKKRHDFLRMIGYKL